MKAPTYKFANRRLVVSDDVPHFGSSELDVDVCEVFGGRVLIGSMRSRGR